MRVSVNLATVSSPGERYALAWSAPLLLFGVLAFVVLVRGAWANLDEYHKVEQRVASVLQREKALKDQENALRKELDEPGQKEVFQKAHYVNGLIAQKKFSLTELTERISRLVPPSVRLVSLSVAHPKNEITVRFSVLGRDEAGLEKFVENLEDADDFTELGVANQEHGGDKKAEGMMGIICTAHYIGLENK